MYEKRIVIDALEDIARMMRANNDWRQFQWYVALEKLAKSVDPIIEKYHPSDRVSLRKLADCVCRLADLLICQDGLLTKATTPHFIRLIKWSRTRYQTPGAKVAGAGQSWLLSKAYSESQNT